MSLFLFGCSTKDIDDVLAATSGNKPPQFFKFTSPEKVEKWYFETKDYKAFPPQTYKKDWELMTPWNGAYIYGGISFGIEHHGKENYPCVVIETGYSDRGVKKKSYDCYKFNPERTTAKRVLVSLIYTKSPNLPKRYQSLAKEYTYEDLLKRSKRVLDSLYIKNGWDE